MVLQIFSATRTEKTELLLSGFSRWFSVDFRSALGFYKVNVGNVADVSEILVASFFLFELCRWVNCLTYSFLFQKNYGRKTGVYFSVWANNKTALTTGRF